MGQKTCQGNLKIINKNKNKTHQNVWDVTKTVFRRKWRVAQDYIKKERRAEVMAQVVRAPVQQV
jgi:hypothetical protein